MARRLRIMATLTLPVEELGLIKQGTGNVATTALDTSPGSHPRHPRHPTVPATASDYIPIPSSNFQPMCHPRVNEVSEEVDGYFLRHWDFKDDRARKKFLNAGFSRVTCLYFPEALDDRIHFACRLLTVLFLIDGEHSNDFALSFLKAGRSSRGHVFRGRLRIQRETDSDIAGRRAAKSRDPRGVYHVRPLGKYASVRSQASR